MTTQYVSDDFQLLVSIANSLKSEYVDPAHDPWEGSPFAWIKQKLSSRQIGKIGEQLVARWATAHNLVVTKSPDSEADKMINGRRIEVKFSTLWEVGVYKFQQIRDQRYEFVVCLGISPYSGHCWVIPKSFFLSHHFKLDGVGRQHGGKAGRGTWWMSFAPENPPTWLRQFGGDLGDAMRLLRAM